MQKARARAALTDPAAAASGSQYRAEASRRRASRASGWADAQLVENADDHAAHVVASPVSARESLEQKVERPLLIAGVERRECRR